MRIYFTNHIGEDHAASSGKILRVMKIEGVASVKIYFDPNESNHPAIKKDVEELFSLVTRIAEKINNLPLS